MTNLSIRDAYAPAAPVDDDGMLDVSPHAHAVDDGLPYVPRSRLLPLPFLFPLACSGVSFLAGGVQLLTDLTFISLILICAVCFFRELQMFSVRFGIGGLIAFGGTLLWFCYAYVQHWLGVDPRAFGLEQWVLAKAAFYHALFVFLMVVGLQLPGGRRTQRLLHAVPEPSSTNVYFLLVLITFVIGMLPYLLFSAEPF